MAQTGGQMDREREGVVSIIVLNFIFSLDPSLNIVRSDWTQVWEV